MAVSCEGNEYSNVPKQIVGSQFVDFKCNLCTYKIKLVFNLIIDHHLPD